MTFFYYSCSSAISGEPLQSIWVARRGTRGRHSRAGAHWPTTQWVWHLQLSVVLTGCFHATGLRHLTTVRGEKNKTDGLWMLLEYFSVWVWLYVSAILVLFKVTQKQAAFPKPSVTDIYLNTCKTCASSNAQKRVRNTHSESSGHVHRGGSFSSLLDMYEFLMHHWRSGAWSYF